MLSDAARAFGDLHAISDLNTGFLAFLMQDTECISHPRSACKALTAHAHLLPRQGKALDLACGYGANAIFLARQGLSVSAWDLSTKAIHALSLFAKDCQLDINTYQIDIENSVFPEGQFDVIVVSYFLTRSIIPHIKDALKVGGLIYYQTFTAKKTKNIGPQNPSYLLLENELLQLFKNFNILVYREEGQCGDTRSGLRNEALLVAQKTSYSAK